MKLLPVPGPSPTRRGILRRFLQCFIRCVFAQAIVYFRSIRYIREVIAPAINTNHMQFSSLLNNKVTPVTLYHNQMKSSNIHHIRILFSVYLTASCLDHTRYTQIVCGIQHTKHTTTHAIYVYRNQLLINHQHYAQPFRVNMPYWTSVLMSKYSGTAAFRK